MKQSLILLTFLGLLLATTQGVRAQEEIQVRNDNGVMYLTTQVVTTNPTDNVNSYATASSTSTRPATPNGSRNAPLEDVEIDLPQGFARSFAGLLNGILSFVLVIAALLVFAFLIWGAFEWITSGGDKGKTDQARQKIMAAIVGLIIIASSYAILTLALRFLGFSSLSDVFDSAGTIQGGAETPTIPESELGEVIQATPSATPETN